LEKKYRFSVKFEAKTMVALRLKTHNLSRNSKQFYLGLEHNRRNLSSKTLFCWISALKSAKFRGCEWEERQPKAAKLKGFIGNADNHFSLITNLICNRKRFKRKFSRHECLTIKIDKNEDKRGIRIERETCVRFRYSDSIATQKEEKPFVG
jgi:hypothetical protein